MDKYGDVACKFCQSHDTDQQQGEGIVTITCNSCGKSWVVKDAANGQ